MESNLEEAEGTPQEAIEFDGVKQDLEKLEIGKTECTKAMAITAKILKGL